MSIILNNAEAASTLHTVDQNYTGNYYIADQAKYYEPQRLNNFEFILPNLNNALTIGQNTWAAANAQEVIKISVSKAFVPHFKVSPLELKRGNNTMKFAGVATFDSGTIELDDFIGAGTKDILVAWHECAYDPQTEKVGLASDYKREAQLIEYTPDHQIVRTWKLLGCWISDISDGTPAYNSNEINRISATIQYDKAYIDKSGIEEEEA